MQHSVLVFLCSSHILRFYSGAVEKYFSFTCIFHLGLCVFIFFKPLCLTQTHFSFVPLPDPIILYYFSYLISKPNIQFLSTINPIAPCLALSLFVDLELAKLENISFFFLHFLSIKSTFSLSFPSKCN